MIINNALKKLWPQTHAHYRRLPIFGKMLDKFAQWSLQQGFDLKTARCHVRSLQHLVPWFQRRGKGSIAELNAVDLAEARAYYRLRDPHRAAAVRKLGRYLQAQNRLMPGRTDPPKPADLVLAGFSEYLRHERGLAEATIENRQYHLRQFLRFLRFDDRRSNSLKGLRLATIERFLVRCARRYCRRAMPIVVATIRSFLRFQHVRGVLSKPLHEQIETVRQYQGEQLPQPASWPQVLQLLKALDRSTALGQRDYTILILAATYGLRRSEAAALTLDDIDWRTRTLRVPQLKTRQNLLLPLTDEVGTALVDYLQRARPRSTFRQVFLRHRPPIGPLPVWQAGRSLAHAAHVTGVKLPGMRFHGLRHAAAMRLLRDGAGLKSISDVLGHRNPNTTAEYLRLDLEDFRSVALPVPHASPASPSLPLASPPVSKAKASSAALRPRVTVSVSKGWRSFLGQSMQDYVARQRSLGRRCQREEGILRRFDGFLARRYPHGRILTAAQFAAWEADLRHPSPTTTLGCLRCARQFCRYLARTRPATFVPDPSTFPKPWPAKLPCLLTPTQVAQLLEGTRVIEPTRLNPLRPKTMRLAIILMFCCGLRRGEVLRLRLRDFDLKEKVLRINESKFHKSRLVPLSASVTRELRTYLRQRAQRCMPMEPAAPFLWNGRTTRSSGPLGPTAIETQWHQTCREAQIFDTRGRPPRLHDLRHSFAVEALRRGYDAGRDAQATLPRLARYMGHVCPAFTHRYLKFTEPIRQAASARFHQHSARTLLTPMARSSRKGGVA